jgi:cold shock CspA family protein
MTHGLVRNFNEHRGWGFIEVLAGMPNGGNPRVFFHKSAIRDRAAIPIGAEVKFDIVRSDKGKQAANVQLVHARLPRSAE